jgi:hypothetical protein
MAVLSVDASTDAASRASARPSAKASSGREHPDPAAAISIKGTMKWFNADRGLVLSSATTVKKMCSYTPPSLKVPDCAD